MTHDPNNRPSSSPFKQAFREARVIALAAVAIAIVYNIFSSNAIDWVRAQHTVDSTGVFTLDSLTGNPPSESPPPDTAIPPAVLPADTAVAPPGLTQHQLDSIRTAQADSVKQAKKLAAAQADSIRAAEEEMIFAKLPTVSEIQTDVAKRLFDSKNRKVLFIDARPEDHFREGHIPGSMNVYAEQWQSQIPELVQISRDQVIVTYCGGGDECELSHDLAKNLKALGFKTVVVYMGGIKDWTAKKYPVATQ